MTKRRLALSTAAALAASIGLYGWWPRDRISIDHPVAAEYIRFVEQDESQRARDKKALAEKAFKDCPPAMRRSDCFKRYMESAPARTSLAWAELWGMPALLVVADKKDRLVRGPWAVLRQLELHLDTYDALDTSKFFVHELHRANPSQLRAVRVMARGENDALRNIHEKLTGKTEEMLGQFRTPKGLESAEDRARWDREWRALEERLNAVKAKGPATVALEAS